MPRPRIRRDPLTVSVLKGAEAGEKDNFLWDDKEHGLAIKITPTGAKIFILQKTVRARLKRITLGKFPDMTLDQARTEARKKNGLIAAGRDPVAEERAEREEEERRTRLEKTMQDLWDRYEVEVIPNNKPRTADEKRRMWNRRIKPAIGKLKIKDVTGIEASEVVRSPLRIDAAGRVRGGKGEAGNLYRLLRHMLYKAIVWGLRPRDLGNPLKEVDQPKLERRQRLFSDKEIGALLGTLDQCAAEKMEHPRVIAAIRAATLTGARINELLTLRWEDIRADEMELHLRDTKSGASNRPISADALKLFQGVERMPGSPFVFRAITRPKEPLGYTLVRKAFDRIAARAGVENCSLHTLRHRFATMTANNSSNPRVGMKLTGHKSHAAYMNYVHAEKEQTHALAEQLATLNRGIAAAPSNVVPVKRKGRA
jgi:integrase